MAERAMSYSDYYKGNTKTPGANASQIGSNDDEEDTITPETKDKYRKKALKRRLQLAKRAPTTPAP